MPCIDSVDLIGAIKNVVIASDRAVQHASEKAKESHKRKLEKRKHTNAHNPKSRDPTKKHKEE